MSATLQQIFALNPTTTIGNNDLFYLVQSPYTPGTDAGILGSDLKAIFGTGTVNPGLINQIGYYASAGSSISGLTTGNNGVLITSAIGAPSILSAGLTNQVLTATTGAPASWKYVPQITQFIVNPVAGLGNYTTIQAAITAASSGTDIYITPGTYTENLTLKAGVHLTTLRGNAAVAGIVTIIGNATFTGTGVVNISNIQLQTNSAPSLTVSGSNASIVNLFGCNINCTNNTGISYTSSNALSQINIARCAGDLGTTGIAFYNMSSAGTLTCRYSNFTNSGNSILQSTNSAGIVNINYCLLLSPVSSSGTGSFLKDYTFVDTSSLNVTSLEMAGSGSSTIRYCDHKSGTASAILIDVGSKVSIFAGTVNSSNTNAISGGGTLNYGMLGFAGSSNTINVSTQIPIALTTFQGGTGLSAYVLGDILYSSAANVLHRLAGNTTAVKQYLSQTGTGLISAPPSWDTITGGDITGAALTKTDDTNVTLTLGGTPSTALLRATSITVGWAGQLGLTRGGMNASLTASNGGIFYSTASAGAILSGTATARQMLQSGAMAIPAWSTATWPATTTANQILFSSAINTVSEITTSANSVLVTSAGSVPSLSTTLPAGLTIPGFAVSGANSDITSMTGLTGYLQAPLGIKDSNGNVLLDFSALAAAVNKVTIQNSNTLNPLYIAATGSDTNIILNLIGKGTGGVSVKGTSTNDDAISGYVGELVSSIIAAASAISVPSVTNKDITSISLSAGDWDVWGNINISTAATTVTLLAGWISSTSVTMPDNSLYAALAPSTGNVGVNSGITVPQRRFSLSVTTTIYLTTRTVQVSGNNLICGGIYARRVR